MPAHTTRPPGATALRIGVRVDFLRFVHYL